MPTACDAFAHHLAARSPHHPPRQPRLRRARPEVVCGAGHQRDGAGHRGHRLPVRAVPVYGHGSGRTELGDTDRYDMLPAVARVFDLDTSSERRLAGPGLVGSTGPCSTATSAGIQMGDHELGRQFGGSAERR